MSESNQEFLFIDMEARLGRGIFLFIFYKLVLKCRCVIFNFHPMSLN